MRSMNRKGLMEDVFRSGQRSAAEGHFISTSALTLCLQFVEVSSVCLREGLVRRFFCNQTNDQIDI